MVYCWAKIGSGVNFVDQDEIAAYRELHQNIKECDFDESGARNCSSPPISDDSIGNASTSIPAIIVKAARMVVFFFNHSLNLWLFFTSITMIAVLHAKFKTIDDTKTIILKRKPID